MAKKAVELRECDRCGKEPAHTWTITGPEGATREIELCERHGAPVANAYALARPVVRKPGRSAGRGRPRSAPAPAAPPQQLPPAPPEPIWR
ncbi:hypothetical protein [Virgisporangium aliadipatigenens]|nr:hypothetical protein [Virgisporangium aliadipatigenens]